MLVACAPSAAVMAAPMRIMAIGDSITHGVDGASATFDASAGGYRAVLAEKLNAAHIDHVWLGTQSDGPAIARYHEGWNGETIREIDTVHLDPAFAALSSPPDVVLLMIGTNDSWHPEWGDELTTRENMLPNLRNLLIRIHGKAPEARIVLSTITPMGFRDPVIDAAREVYNNGMPDLVGELQGMNYNIGLVNAGGRVPPELLPDAVHPSTAGYQLIGEGFFDAFMMPSAPEPTLLCLPMLLSSISVVRPPRRRL
jgi:lysophospholipase L1-like esterase